MVNLLWEYPAEPHDDAKVLGVYQNAEDAEKDIQSLRQAGSDSTFKIVPEEILTQSQGMTTIFSGITQASEKELELLKLIFGAEKAEANQELVDIFEANIEKLETLAVNGPRVHKFAPLHEVDLREKLPGQVEVWGTDEEKVRKMILAQKLHFALLSQQNKKDQE